jgi:two-component system repressor protein LuxO
VPRVLIVDDALPARLTFAALLQDAGYEVVEAGSLAEGRGKLALGRFELAIIDLQLPDGLGTLLLPDLRRAQPGAVIVVLSGNDLGTLAGVDLTLAKGEAPDALLRKIDRAVSARRASGANG